MLKANVAVLVSGGGTNLQALIDAQQSGIINSGEIKLVVANNANAYALERARISNIDTAIVLKSQCGSQEAFENELIRVLEEAKTDLIVLAGFMSILSARFTNHFKDRIINVHPSLIPSFCGKGFYGLKVHEAALEYGVKVSGATVHFVNEIPDGGKIIMQRAVDVLEDDTPEVLQRRIMEQVEWKILPLSCEKICAEIIKEKANEHLRN